MRYLLDGAILNSFQTCLKFPPAAFCLFFPPSCFPGSSVTQKYISFSHHISLKALVISPASLLPRTSLPLLVSCIHFMPTRSAYQKCILDHSTQNPEPDTIHTAIHAAALFSSFSGLKSPTRRIEENTTDFFTIFPRDIKSSSIFCDFL